jgi:hypothetical protein
LNKGESLERIAKEWKIVKLRPLPISAVLMDPTTTFANINPSPDEIWIVELKSLEEDKNTWHFMSSEEFEKNREMNFPDRQEK